MAKHDDPSFGRPEIHVTVNPRNGLYPQSVSELAFISEEVTEEDQAIYDTVTSTTLTPEQEQRIVQPHRVLSGEQVVMGLHWHPEFVPMNLIEQRLAATFPHAECQFIVPTQHNRILDRQGYSGVEVDCYAKAFRLKVQLLMHFKTERLQQADILKGMIDHTFNYRSNQLLEFLASILDSAFADRLERAVKESSADPVLVRFVQIYSRKLIQLIERNESRAAPEMLRNKLVREFFDGLRNVYADRFIDHAQLLLRAIKVEVKRAFNPRHFYEVNEIIEEARSCGAGIIVPHPEQFWPILLADYDVDGFEVWNPQSRAYTEFLISAVQRLNRTATRRQRPLLVTMGDDCHMGEKVKDSARQDAAKAAREIGVQPAWDDLAVRKRLARHTISKQGVIEEYRSRLS